MNAPAKFGKHSGMGQSVLRKEDGDFITGTGLYTDDVRTQDALHAFVLRSAYAHARFTITDRETAAQSAGVRLVLTAEDLGAYGPIKCMTIQTQKDGTKHESKDIPLLAQNIVRHVGDAIAFVVADSMEQAREAAELIEVDYDMLDSVTDIEAALEPDSALVYDDLGANLAFETENGTIEQTKEQFAKADKIVELKLINNRLVCNYMEPRACLAEWSAKDERFTLTAPSQGVFGMRNAIAEPCLKIKPEQLRIITPDVGGGFGTKAFAYREYPLCLIAARELNRDVRWRCDRNEHFMVDAHGRDNVVTMRMALDKSGKFLALDIDLIAAMGAYLHMFGPFIPHLGMTIATGIYFIEACTFRVRGVYTHTTPTDAYRGAGRPEAIYALERLVDKCALEMDMSPDAIRRLNAIEADRLPYTTPFSRQYDTGEFMAHMEACMKAAKWDSFDARAKQT